MKTLKIEKNKFVRNINELKESSEPDNHTDASWLASESQDLLSKCEQEKEKHEVLYITLLKTRYMCKL